MPMITGATYSRTSRAKIVHTAISNKGAIVFVRFGGGELSQDCVLVVCLFVMPFLVEQRCYLAVLVHVLYFVHCKLLSFCLRTVLNERIM